MKTLGKLLMLSFVMLKASVSAQEEGYQGVWKNVIQLEDGVLLKYALNDIPGSICVLVPIDGGIKAYLVGNKVLKKGVGMPKLDATPTQLVSEVITKEMAGNASYLSFLEVSMGVNDEVKFSASESSKAVVNDGDIDWPEFEKRVAVLRAKLPVGARFGIVRVASVLTINHQTFYKVRNEGKIAGWGFSGGGKYLSEKNKESTTFKVGVALTFSTADIFKEFPPLKKDHAGLLKGGLHKRSDDQKSTADDQSSIDYALVARTLSDAVSQQLVGEIKSPAQIVDEKIFDPAD